MMMTIMYQNLSVSSLTVHKASHSYHVYADYLTGFLNVAQSLWLLSRYPLIRLPFQGEHHHTYDGVRATHMSTLVLVVLPIELPWMSMVMVPFVMSWAYLALASDSY